METVMWASSARLKCPCIDTNEEDDQEQGSKEQVEYIVTYQRSSGLIQIFGFFYDDGFSIVYVV
jgi:hypothetical protein